MGEDSLNKKLRIGLFMDSFDVPHWAYVMLKKIQESDYAEIKLIVFNSRITSNWDNLLYLTFCNLENKVFKSTPDAFEIKNAKSVLADVPHMKVKSIQDVEPIKEHQIDVFIRLGFGALKGKILDCAKFGIWSYHQEGTAGFWEVFKNIPVTCSTLQMLTNNLDNGLLLYQSYSCTDELSVNWNRNQYFWKALSFIPRKLKELHDLGEEKFFAQVRLENKQTVLSGHVPYGKPGNREFLIGFFPYMARCIKFGLYHLFFLEQWILMFDLGGKEPVALSSFKRIVPAKDRFWADPYIIYKDNQYYVFIEEFLFKSKKGHIALIIIDEKGHYSKPVTVLERPYHLSYPFVFQWNTNYYMIPESSSNRTIEIYKCIKFPDQWEFHKNLMTNINASDATLFNYHGKWWLFANVVENEGASSWDELFLFYADNPLSCDWVPHPKNPVISDVRKSRPAGKIFEHNGNVYRPSQNSSGRYGHGIKINRITVFNESEYQETEINSIEPDFDRKIKAVHTFNQEHGLSVADGVLRRRKGWGL